MWLLHASREWGWEAFQCAPQRQPAVVEVCWEVLGENCGKAKDSTSGGAALTERFLNLNCEKNRPVSKNKQIYDALLSYLERENILVSRESA